LLQGKAIIQGDSLEEVWALRDVDFEIRRGEAVGIIGRNGAGKSTLLKVLSRITEPTTGRVTIHGRVASLLEVGTGFHPELSGRENVYLNGAILGMTRQEIKRKFDEIVAFAEVEKFLDTPVKRFSSGMYVRLAFAVAAHLEPEILVVDEVLAVGDVTFQRKCLAKMSDVTKQGLTVLFVSHNLAAVRHLCSKGIWLDGGELRLHAPVDECANAYLSMYSGGGGLIIDHGKKHNNKLDVTSIKVGGSVEDNIVVTSRTETLEIEIIGEVHEPIRASVEAQLKDLDGTVIATYAPGLFSENLEVIPVGRRKFCATIALPKLNRGRFSLDIFLTVPGAMGLWSFRDAVQIDTEGWPIASGLTLDIAQRGAFFLEGEVGWQ
jgi:lipopolysaccharide transport system ATP-binding protein